MKPIISALMTLILGAASQLRPLQLSGGLLSSLGGDPIVSKEIASIKQPVDETIATIGSSQCSNAKRLLGVEYDQIEDSNEPDLSRLTLNFISQENRISYSLSEAARLLPQTQGYNPRNNLIIYMHGFTDDPDGASFSTVNEAFMRRGEFNILALDASSLIRLLYLRSTTYVRFIGTRLGEVLAAAVNSGTNPSSIHLIGHSLGSHIAGFAGKTFTELTGLRVGRISGLDPAGPCFTDIDQELRLNRTDADFVDAIHTDAGVFGLREPVGQVDYYPNGGSQQPNCLFQACSHDRAWVLYAESVTSPDAFPAVACSSWDAFRNGQCSNDISLMGYGSEAGTRGVYFLRTGEAPPYGLGRAGLVYRNNEGIVRNIGNVLPVKNLLG